MIHIINFCFHQYFSIKLLSRHTVVCYIARKPVHHIWEHKGRAGTHCLDNLVKPLFSYRACRYLNLIKQTTLLTVIAKEQFLYCSAWMAICNSPFAQRWNSCLNCSSINKFWVTPVCTVLHVVDDASGVPQSIICWYICVNKPLWCINHEIVLAI